METGAGRCTTILGSFLLLSGSVVAASSPMPRAEPAQEPGQRPEYRAEVVAPQHDAFGFRVGEERRYARGPERIFRAGEYEHWTIRLDGISNANTGMPLYEFTYGRDLSLIDPGNPENSYNLEAKMSVTVNHYGFPIDVRYGGGADDDSDTDFVYKHGRLRWLGGGYLFRAPEGAEERSFNFVLPEHDALHPGIPTGVFLSETENPALITITAAIFQALGVTDMEFLSLRPNRIGRQQARRPRRRGDPGGNRRTDVVRGRLQFRGIEELEIGGRTYEAIRLDSRDNNEDLFVDHDGTLLLMEQDFRNWTNAYIRLLHPSEY